MAVREEARRRCKETRERDRRQVERRRDGRQGAQQRCHRAKVAAQVALAEAVRVVPASSGSAGVVPRVLMVGVLMLTVVHHVMFHLGTCGGDGALAFRTGGRAQHCSRYRTPNGEQHGKQHEQPNTNGSHRVVRLSERHRSIEVLLPSQRTLNVATVTRSSWPDVIHAQLSAFRSAAPPCSHGHCSERRRPR